MGIENMLFADAQSYTWFRSCCKVLQSVISSILVCIRVPSAKLMRFDSDMSYLISASVIRKSSGPNTIPCGTPLSTGESPLIAPGSLTKYTKMSSDSQ